MPGMRGPSRRAPFPGDIACTGIQGVSGTYHFMLGKPAEPPHAPPLVASLVQEAQPEDQTMWTDWSRGMGVRVDVGEPGRYFYALGVDGSIEHQLGLGPLITTITPDSSLDTTNGIQGFFEIGSTLFAVNGRYVLKRAADTAAGWGSGSTIKDLGSGKAAFGPAIVHKQNGGTNAYAYVPMGDSEHFWRLSDDATTWTQHGSLFARSFALAARELWRANNVNAVAKVDSDADPWTAGNWSNSNSFTIGDNSSGINGLFTTSSNALLIVKTDGVYALDENGQDIQLWPDLKFTPDATNGKYVFNYEDSLHCTLNGRHFRVGTDLSIEHIGPERASQNDGPVRGYVTAGCGTPFAAYAGLYNPDTQKSYLMKFGAWATVSTFGSNVSRTAKLDAWHGSISQSFDSKIITAMRRSTIGAPARHERLYLGFSDGTIGWFTLPCVPNPYSCSSYATPNTSGNYIFMPAWSGGNPQQEKHLRMFSLSAVGISSAPSVDVGTAAIGDTTTSSFAEVSFTAAPGGHAEIATDTVYALADVRIELKGSGSTAFKVLGLGLRYMAKPPPGLIREMSVIVKDGLVKRNGVPFRYGADEMRSLLRSILQTQGSFTVYWPDETSEEVSVVDYGESTAWYDRTKRWEQAIKVRVIQAQRLTAITGSSTGSLT